jgi:hypothetical protein
MKQNKQTLVGEIDAWLANMDEAAMEKGIGEAADAMRVRIRPLILN